MIDPWIIIGWVLVVILMVISTIILLKMLRLILQDLVHYVRHLKTRNDTPVKGEQWIGRKCEYYIDSVFDDGYVVLRTGNSTIGRSAKDWKDLVRDRKLRRVV